MQRRTGSRGTRRAYLLVLGIGAPAGALLAACSGSATPAPQRARDFHDVTLQYTTKGSGPADMADYQKVIGELFEPAHPGIKVELITEGSDSYWVKLTSLLAAGTPPDAAQQDEYYLAPLAVKSQLLELGPYQAKDATFEASDLSAGLWQAGHYHDKLFGITVGPFGPVVYYNKDHFDEAGVPYPPSDYKQGGWTWNRMREDAKKLAKVDASGALTRAGFGWDARFLSRFSGHFYAYGAKVFDRQDDPSRCTLDDPLSLELIQLLHDMRHVDRTAAPADWYGGSGDSRTKGLPGDNAAIFRDGRMSISIQLSDLVSTRKTNLRWDQAPLPRPNGGGNAGGFVGTNVYTAMRASKIPDVAWDWIAVMAGKQRSAWRMRSPDLVAAPAWKSLIPEYSRLTPPDHNGVNAELGEYGTPSIMSTAYAEVQDVVLNGLQAVWNNQAPVRQSVADIVPKANDLLAKAPKV
jgi:multiple sugar transport system substrate-binding protein